VCSKEAAVAALRKNFLLFSSLLFACLLKGLWKLVRQLQGLEGDHCCRPACQTAGAKLGEAVAGRTEKQQ